MFFFLSVTGKHEAVFRGEPLCGGAWPGTISNSGDGDMLVPFPHVDGELVFARMEDVSNSVWPTQPIPARRWWFDEEGPERKVDFGETRGGRYPPRRPGSVYDCEFTAANLAPANCSCSSDAHR